MQNEAIIVQGGNRLSGTVHVNGAKNSVLKLMAASILADGVSTITNVPDISDVHIMAELLRYLGAVVSLEDARLTIDSSNVMSKEPPYDLVSKFRASIAVLGPLLARFGEAVVSMPGGCGIGSRKIDMHLAGLVELGVTYDIVGGNVRAHAGKSGIQGSVVKLAFASVGATENLMLAATRAHGTTIIENVAREPEIVDLVNFLNKMGAHIEGAGSPILTIHGVDKLHPVRDHCTVGDRIEAGTYLVAGALCDGVVTVEGVNPEHLTVPLRKLRDFGCDVICEPEGSSGAIDINNDGDESFARITISHAGDFVPTDIQTLPYPGFPTDLQPQFMVLDAIANGSSVITENVFESRFVFADELNRMGADITIDGHHALIKGVKKLSGAPVQAPDLRAGAGLLLAGLVAGGTTIVNDIEHIDRGYEDIVERLAKLGANITRESK